MEECNICFHDLDIETAWKCKKCKQICHQFCIETWYKNREVCPFCIQSISDTQLQYIDNDLGDSMLNHEVEITIRDQNVIDKITCISTLYFTGGCFLICYVIFVIFFIISHE